MADKKGEKGKKNKRKLEYPYPHGARERLLPAFSAVGDITTADVEEYGLRGLPIPYTMSDEMEAESREDRLDRVYKARNKRIKDSKKAKKNRKKVSALVKENPSLHKDVRGLRLKKGGKVKKSKPKVRGAGIAQRGVRPARIL